MSNYATVKAEILLIESILDFPPLKPLSFEDIEVILKGVENSDPISIGVPPECVNDNVSLFAWVSQDHVITVRYINHSDTEIKIASGNFKFVVFKTNTGDAPVKK